MCINCSSLMVFICRYHLPPSGSFSEDVTDSHALTLQAETSTASAHPRLEAFPLSCEQMTCDQAGKMAY